MDNLQVKASSTDTLLGLNQIANDEDFSVFPNPATNLVSISSTSNFSINNVEMFDINGRIIKSIPLDNLSNVDITISDLSSGVYMMRITTDQGTATKKIVKQ